MRAIYLICVKCNIPPKHWGVYGKDQAGNRLFKFIPVITGVADRKEQTDFDCAQIYCLAVFVLTLC